MDLIMKLMRNKYTLMVVAFGVALVFAVFSIGNSSSVSGQDQDDNAWVKRCENADSPDAGYCEVFQRLIVTETGQRVLEFAVGFPKDSNAARGVIVLPLGVLIQPGLEMKIDDNKSFQFQMRYCTGEGCYAFVNLNDAVLDMMRKGNTLSVLFQDGTGNKVDVQLTLKGFVKALKQIN